MNAIESFTRSFVRTPGMKAGLLLASLAMASVGLASEANAAGPYRGQYSGHGSGYTGFARQSPYHPWTNYGHLHSQHDAQGFVHRLHGQGFDAFTQPHYYPRSYGPPTLRGIPFTHSYHPTPTLRGVPFTTPYTPSKGMPGYSPGLRHPNGFQP